jgi:hypothetical protein
MAEKSVAENLQDYSVGEDLIKRMPQFAALFAGLCYATGFVVELTFLERFGIHETVRTAPASDVFESLHLHLPPTTLHGSATKLVARDSSP